MQSYYNIIPAYNPPRLKTFVINLRSCAEGVSNADRGIKTSTGISLRQLVLGSSITTVRNLVTSVYCRAPYLSLSTTGQGDVDESSGVDHSLVRTALWLLLLLLWLNLFSQ